MISDGPISTLVGAIYDCALDPTLWLETMGALNAHMRFGNSTLSLTERPAGTLRLSVTSGIASPWLERLPRYGADLLELWGGEAVAGGVPLELPLLLSRVNASVGAGQCDNRFFREWFVPQGYIDTVGINLERDKWSVSVCTFTRHRDDGPIGEAELDLVRLFAPHVRRATTISRLLDTRTVSASLFEATLDKLATPVLLVDDSLRLVHANHAAQLLLATGIPLRERKGMLTANNPDVEAMLKSAACAALVDEAVYGRTGLGIPAQLSDGSFCALNVLPLAQGAVRRQAGPGAAIAIFVAAQRGPSAAMIPLLARHHQLTTAEARVLDALTQGQTIAEIAARLELKESTVRTHVLQIFQKMGVHRQTDLIRLASSLSLP